MNRADQRGYITFDDILEVLEDEGDEVATIESILYELDELGVELRNHGEGANRNGVVEDQEIDFEPAIKLKLLNDKFNNEIIKNFSNKIDP